MRPNPGRMIVVILFVGVSATSPAFCQNVTPPPTLSYRLLQKRKG